MHIKRMFGIGMALIALVSGQAMADNLNVSVSTGFGDTWVSSQEGDPDPESATVFTGSGNHEDKDWSVDWTMRADTDPYVSGHFSVTNLGVAPQDFVVTFSAPVSVDIPGVLAMVGGSTAGSVTDANNSGDGGLVTIPGLPFYRGLVNGTPALDIHTDPFNVPIAFPGETAQIPAANPGLPGGGIASPVGILIGQEIAIEHRFTLAPGDAVGFTSFFLLVPEPTSLILLGLGCLFCVRRRR